LKLLYTTQVAVQPPTFVIFVNDTELVHFSFKRFIENRIREAFGYIGTPIHIYARKRSCREIYIMKEIAVIGAGRWGTALNMVLHDSGQEVRLWTHREAQAEDINHNNRKKHHEPKTYT